MRAAGQDAGNARQAGYVKAALAERQLCSETLGASDDEVDGVNVRALGVGEPQPPAELDGAAVFVMRKPGFQADVGRAGEAVGYSVPHVERNEDRAECR